MTKQQYILSLDQGTTSSRSILFDKNGELVKTSQQEFTQLFPNPGWVEHDPLQIFETQYATAQDVIQQANIQTHQIKAIGITNQRETTVVWDKRSGKPIHHAIVWQDRRTASICDELKSKGFASEISKRTGLVVDAYFSGTKIKWILDHVSGAHDAASRGDLLFGTIDTWLIWNLSKGALHITDVSNASRTLLFNIQTMEWDEDLLEAMDVPGSMLPTVVSSSEVYGMTHPDYFGGYEIPIAGIAGDQQAALFGQACFDPGLVKNTYGTGCFLLMNTGQERVVSKSGLLTTVAWQIDDTVSYALEGSVFVAGAAIQWLRDGLKSIKSAEETEKIAIETNLPEDLYVVPAFAGLGAPYWDMYARGAILGITRDTTQHQIIKATLHAIAYQTKDVISAMEKDADMTIRGLRVDGGASQNNYLMQFQSDLLDTLVQRPSCVETTALGAAFLAGMAVGFYTKAEIQSGWNVDRQFSPGMKEAERNRCYNGWKKAVKRTMNWVEADKKS